MLAHQNINGFAPLRRHTPIVSRVRTAHPLDIGRNSFTGDVRGGYESNQKDVTPRVERLVNYVTEDRAFGFNLGVGYQKRRSRNYSFDGLAPKKGVESQRAPLLD